MTSIWQVVGAAVADSSHCDTRRPPVQTASAGCQQWRWGYGPSPRHCYLPTPPEPPKRWISPAVVENPITSLGFWWGSVEVGWPSTICLDVDETRSKTSDGSLSVTSRCADVNLHVIGILVQAEAMMVNDQGQLSRVQNVQQRAQYGSLALRGIISHVTIRVMVGYFLWVIHCDDPSVWHRCGDIERWTLTYGWMHDRLSNAVHCIGQK